MSWRKIRAIHFAPLLAVVALLAWVFASPVGASPDDDYHLVSTWCVTGGELCEPGSSDSTRVVPEVLFDNHCYATDPFKSAACQSSLDIDESEMVESARGNFVGAYPPVYYTVMSIFAGDDLVVSAVTMRIVTVILFVAMTSLLFVSLASSRRSTLVLAWLATLLPMGAFLIASNNPSGWAVIGLGTGWLALLGYLESVGWRKWTLGALFVVATLMAAGSRGDAAMYSLVGIGAVFLLTVPWHREGRTRETWLRYARNAILPVVMAVVSAFFFLTSRQTASGVGGFGSVSNAPADDIAHVGAQGIQGFSLFAYNLLNIPFLWMGNFGEWGLGWLDTALPSIVSFATVAVIVATVFSGYGHMWGRKFSVVVLSGLVLWLLPLWVLQQGGHSVGTAVQPRYVLPLIVLFIGLSLLTRGSRPLSFSRAQLVLIGGGLSLAYLVALHFNLRRYLTGADVVAFNLDFGYEWWWNVPFSPMAVWLAGTAAFVGLVTILLMQLRRTSLLETNSLAGAAEPAKIEASA